MKYWGQKGVTILNRAIREALPEKGTSEQRPEGSEESLRTSDRRAFQTKEEQVRSP